MASIRDPGPRAPEHVYGPALEKARRAFRQLEPRSTAARADVHYHDLGSNRGQFLVPFFGRLYGVHWPEGTVDPEDESGQADIATSILLLHYLLSADGTPLSGQWIAFRNLPGGLGYDPAFHSRANLRLARAFESRQAAFEHAARLLGGERLSFGDLSFAFRLLPRAWLAVVLHFADEEFPSDASVLFDAASSHYLPTEDLAVLGGMLAGRLIKAGKAG